MITVVFYVTISSRRKLKEPVRIGDIKEPSSRRYYDVIDKVIMKIFCESCYEVR